MYRLMTTHTNFHTISFILILVGLAGCEKKTPQSSASNEIGFGEFKEGIYSNDYFNLSVKIPTDWTVQSIEERLNLTEVGAQIISGDDKNLAAMAKASELESVPLLSTFKHPLGAPVESNPNLMSVADRVIMFPGIKRGSDYLFHTKKLLSAGQLEVEFTNEGYSKTIGKKEFDAMDLTMRVGGIPIYQKYYCTIANDYALAFIITFANEQEETELQHILDKISFE